MNEFGFLFFTTFRKFGIRKWTKFDIIFISECQRIWIYYLVKNEYSKSFSYFTHLANAQEDCRATWFEFGMIFVQYYHTFKSIGTWYDLMLLNLDISNTNDEMSKKKRPRNMKDQKEDCSVYLVMVFTISCLFLLLFQFLFFFCIFIIRRVHSFVVYKIVQEILYC